MQIFPHTRRELLALLGRQAVFVGVLAGALAFMVAMPGRSYRGALPPLTDEEARLTGELRASVQKLAGDIGPRHLHRPDALEQAAAYVESELRAAGLSPARQSYAVRGQTVSNIEAEQAGHGALAGELVVVGAHYDAVETVDGCPGANDNGTGTAVMLALARQLRGRTLARTVRFVGFVNEEPPYFWTGDMGSVRAAKRSRERGERITAMLSLETLGSYSDRPGSQAYPFPFSLVYPTTADFVAFVGNVSSRAITRQAVGAFRREARFPSEGAAPVSFIGGVGLSDHWSYWQEDYPAVMVTDTAFFRYRWYHTPQDTPDKIDHERLARVTAGLTRVVIDLAGGEAGR